MTEPASPNEAARLAALLSLDLLDTAPEPGFDAAHLVRFEKVVKGSFAYSDAEFSHAIDIASELNLSWSTTYDLGEGAEVFNALMNGQTTPIKALLRP